METNFDCIVIGAGPAGLSAALNLRQRGKTVLVVHSGETLLAKAEQVDNYLGMPGLSGKQMMERFTQHARDAGAVLRKGRAGNVMPFGGRFMVNLDGDILETGAVVLACGVSKAKPVPGEAELLGRGVSYCATCDGGFFRGRDVAVIGGGNTALEDAVYLSALCPTVWLIHRRDQFRAERHLIDALAGKDNIKFLMEHRVLEIRGEHQVEALRLVGPEGETTLPVAGVFAAVGLIPDNAPFSPPVELDQGGYIRSGEDCATNVPGVFAAGDTRTKDLRQLVTAAADGAAAASRAGQYLGLR